MSEKVARIGRCAYCGERAEGNYGVHRDGFCEGPEVDLCDTCGKDETPTLEEIWARISQLPERVEARRPRRRFY